MKHGMLLAAALALVFAACGGGPTSPTGGGAPPPPNPQLIAQSPLSAPQSLNFEFNVILEGFTVGGRVDLHHLDPITGEAVSSATFGGGHCDSPTGPICYFWGVGGPVSVGIHQLWAVDIASGLSSNKLTFTVTPPQ